LDQSGRPVKFWDLWRNGRYGSEAPKLKVVISGGGTGGHVFPAIAIANALKSAYKNIDILFVGAKGRLEMEKVPQAGYPIEGLWISGIQRRLTLKNLLFPFKLISSLWKARGILRRFRPDVVVGVGGYASGPTLEMAARMGIPALIQEQNSFPGITNRLLAKKVERICVAYPEMARFFPAEKIVMTGNPVRQDIAELDDKRGPAFTHYALDPDKKTILVLGGSGGARSINESLKVNTAAIAKAQNVQILWQCGKFYFEEYEKTETAQLENVHIRAFLERMDLAYALADLVIARAGALTISELCIVGKPSILIPSPFVAEDHQTRNAEALSSRNAAILQKDSEAATAVPKALKLLEHENELEALRTNIQKMSRPDAASRIADEVLGLIEISK
jgi:UDP-N-acetylglucosamine--N-acetylmuramyl-(pentapeptide) pyrophosphoryl-undecaprenol N-acetylglucosamine transferase